jgi:hypothetical protein
MYDLKSTIHIYIPYPDDFTGKFYQIGKALIVDFTDHPIMRKTDGHPNSHHEANIALIQKSENDNNRKVCPSILQSYIKANPTYKYRLKNPKYKTTLLTKGFVMYIRCWHYIS